MSPKTFLAACLLLGSAFHASANTGPAAPFINEPGVDGQIVNAADFHMETHPFSDPDSAATPDGTFRGTDFEIWTVTPSQRIWNSPGMTGVESFHTHLGDGAFENSHAGRTDLMFDTDYVFRVRHRDNSNDPATEYSPYSTRPFRTGSASSIFPIMLLDVLESPAPLWITGTNQPVILPTASTPPSLKLVASDNAYELLEIRGNNGSTNTIINPEAGDHDHAFKVIISAGSAPLSLPATTLAISDNLATRHTVYLPSIGLGAGQAMVLWVSANGSTYHGSIGDTAPDFSSLARGSAVPWVARQPGYVVEVVASGFRMPVNIAFIPNPGPNPEDALYYVTELYGAIKVVRRNGQVSTYADNLLNYTPSGAFPGSGEQGMGGIAVHPVTGNVYVAMLRNNGGSANHPRLVRFNSTDGGLTAATQTVLLNMAPEVQGQSHFCSNLTIGPDDKLYLHNGDGFDASTSLNMDQYRGKVLRVNLDGTAPTDNPFYNAGNGIGPRDYIYAYGLRNPFGGAWRASDQAHYEVENGPSRDRMAKITRGTSYGYTGANADMSINAIYNWEISTGPVNMSFIEPETFGGSLFPASKMGRAYVTLSGPTYGLGPQSLGKRIEEFQINASGAVVGAPQTLVEYNGSGRATACGIAAGPDGIYFTDLYKDVDTTGPTATGANVLRIRFAGFASFSADVTSGELPLPVQFTDSSDVPGATAWAWDFGDGTGSTVQNPLHTYTTAGLYHVSLAVTGANGVVQTRRSAYIAAGVEAPAVNYRYYRFKATKLRGATTTAVQLSEFEFLHEGASVIPANVPLVSNPGGNNPVGETAPNLVDRNTATKWLDGNRAYVIFDFGDSMQIDSYGFSTANDFAERDPVSWTLEGSHDGSVWDLLDTKADQGTPTARFTPFGPFSAVNEQLPRVLSFTADNPILEPGQSTTLRWQTEGADNAILSPVPGVVTADGSFEISPAATQTYTLTVGNGAGSVNATRTVEIRERTATSFRSYRFTPTKLRDDAAANSVQLAEFDLYRNGIALTGATATNPGRNGIAGEEAPMAVDNNVNTKWNDHNKGTLILSFPAPVAVDGYGFTTANDVPARDPVSWKLEGSDNGTTWTLIDTVSDYPTPAARFSATPDIPLAQVFERVLMVVHEGTNPNLAELNVADRFSDLGFAVDFVTDSLSTTAMAEGKSLVFISSTVTSGQVAAKYRNVAVPVITCEHAIYDDMSMTANTTADHEVQMGVTSVQMTNTTHPLAAGHTGTVAVYNVAGNMPWGNPVASAVRIACVPGNTARSVFFAYEKGSSMVGGFVAPARRVGFFFEDISGESASGHGWHFFETAVEWAVNTPPQIGFTAPAPGSTVPAGQPLPLQVNVTGRNISGVEYRDGAALLGTVTLPPYHFTWPNPGIGSHSLTAKVIDAVGETAVTPALALTAVSPYDIYRGTYFTPAQLANPQISGPGADFDGDGFNTAMEYYFGTNPVTADLPQRYEAVRSGAFGEFSFRHRASAPGVQAIVEASDGLGAWESGGDRVVLVNTVDHGDGTVTSTYHSLLPELPMEFFRISVTLP